MSTPPVKKQSVWITYVKKFAADNNIKYNEALRDPKLKEGYEPAPKKQRKFTMGKDSKKVFCVEHPDMVLVSKAVAEEASVKPMMTVKSKKVSSVKEEMVEPMAKAEKEMVVSSKKVGAKRQTLGKGRDLTLPESAVMMDEEGVLTANLLPTKKGRPKKK